jgi:iron complex transport system permease protein
VTAPRFALSSRLGWKAPVIGMLVLLLTLVLGLLVGAAGLGIEPVALALLDALPLLEADHGLTAVQHSVLFEIRFPRMVLGGLVGAVLALAGAAYQGVFRNPLADPFLLGVAAGSGLGATIALATTGNSALLAPFAFAGGLVAVGITYVLGRSVGGRTETGRCTRGCWAG